MYGGTGAGENMRKKLVTRDRKLWRALTVYISKGRGAQELKNAKDIIAVFIYN